MNCTLMHGSTNVKFQYISQYFITTVCTAIMYCRTSVAVKLNEKEETYARENKGRRKSSSL